MALGGSIGGGAGGGGRDSSNAVPVRDSGNAVPVATQPRSRIVSPVPSAAGSTLSLRSLDTDFSVDNDELADMLG